ncbi:tail fiber domain-containing protein [Agrobacterium pusense]|uniref:tail fiber domain-containing protein n=1 Tax=Agrobacterium pusense TaxID=648995 RepID=UPI001C6E4798|nr:tail fiber domain-containing protein [Agrobacterium pusense]MBW9067143.1 tail fiber domain-containing protein [Agrobacterium pusense]MBW9082911.1 tail fiber domain-containing protein [Agrobacterium pusense]MBW9124843.1 tail fiber domain-containing protein [Agrobacterium pusense]MBW9135581.1 tail fiber domain-containing protein [Agrobacterium pusense]
MGVSDGRLCIGEASRGDIGCPSYAPTVSPTGNLSLTAGLAVNSVSLSTAGTTWGYLGSAASYIPNLNTNNISLSTINGVSVTSLGNMTSPTNVPAFRVTKGGTDQALPTSTYTKLTWNTKSIDTYNNFDLGTGRFTPTIAGHYLIHLAVGCNNATQAANACVASIIKNGTKVSQQVNRAAEFDVTTDATIIVYLNGTTDYVEATAYNEAANAAITGTISYTYFEGSLLASGNGLISGTGVTALSAMSDVALSSPVTGQVLTYNGSEWVNRTPAASNTVSGTSTVITGWPDALRCNITTPNSGPRIIPLSYAPWTDGKYFYRTHHGFDEYIGLVFNADGSFYANDYNTKNSGLQPSASDCSNKSISQLYAEGKAFNYIGNNGAGGGSRNAEGDRISSNTTSVVAETSGLIRINTNGVNTGYFDTIGRLVTPGVSSTGAISGTRGHFSRLDVLNPSNTTLQVFSTVSGVRGGMSSDIPSAGAFYVGSYSEVPLALGTHNAERMRITAGGQVGIGTASPQAPLEVAGLTTARAIAQGSVGLGHISETGWDGNGIIFTNSYETSTVTHRSIVQNGGKLHFGRHSSSGHVTDMFIADTGRIGIGTNSPRASLDSPRGAVFDQISVGVCAFASCPGDNNVEYPYETIQLPPNTNLRVSFGSYQPFMFGNNGHALKPGGGTWNALSDRRLKDLDGTYTHGLKQIVALEPVRFHYKKNNAMRQPSDREFVGLIAQDVLPHFPEAVHKEKDGYYRLDTTPISFAMINAVKELKAENDQLRAANDNLSKDLQALRHDFEDFKRQQFTGERPAMSPSGRSSHIPHKNEPI